MIRKGLGKGMGKGYYNLMSIDSHIHSLSAKGVKSKPVRVYTVKTPKGYRYSFSPDKLEAKGRAELKKEYDKVKEQLTKAYKLREKIEKMSYEELGEFGELNILHNQWDIKELSLKRRKLLVERMNLDAKGIRTFPKQTDMMKLRALAEEVSSVPPFASVSNPNSLLVVMPRGDVLAFTYYAMKLNLLNEKDFNTYLDEGYTLTEFPTLSGKKPLKEMFDNSNPKLLMEKKDYEKYLKLPDKVTVYRGLQHKTADIKSLSWTLDKDVATFFAKRWVNAGIQKKINPVYKAKIDKEHIYMYDNEREEEEIVLDYTKLQNITLIH